MAVRVYISGSITDESGALISVFDRGFLYGDSVYEVLRTSSGNPVDVEAHLDRLERSGNGLLLEVPPRGAIEKAVRETLAAAGNEESYVRIVVTRGGGDIGLSTDLADGPRLIVIVRDLALPAPELYERGASLCIVSVERTSRRAVDPALKSGNYLNSILALAEASKKGAYEALMCNPDGRVAEGSTSNVFVVRGGKVITPSLETGVLAGITRMRLLQLGGAAGIALEEGALMPEDVRTADEVFITSSIRGVLPITTVDGSQVGDGAPGPITRQLMALYDEYLRNYAAP